MYRTRQYSAQTRTRIWIGQTYVRLVDTWTAFIMLELGQIKLYNDHVWTVKLVWAQTDLAWLGWTYIILHRITITQKTALKACICLQSESSKKKSSSWIWLHSGIVLQWTYKQKEIHKVRAKVKQDTFIDYNIAYITKISGKQWEIFDATEIVKFNLTKHGLVKIFCCLRKKT